MKFLFLVKYFEPFDRGGSEWSTENLARLLAQKGHKIKIITPNYGYEKKYSLRSGYEIHRMPFPIKSKDTKSTIAPYWTNNIVWFFYTTLYVLIIAIKGNYEVIHIQNNEFIPAGVTTAAILRKKSVITFRDYQILCPLSFCFWRGKRSCDLTTFGQDINFFIQNYTENNITTKIVVNISAYRAYIIAKLLKYIASTANVKVAVSKSVAEVFTKNGIKDVKVLDNVVLINKKNLSGKKQETVVYVGKLSPGKGVDVFMYCLKPVISKLKNAKVLFIGSGLLKNQLEAYITNNQLEARVQILGQRPHNATLAIVRSSKLVVVPSTWPEPLPRSVIETLLLGIPVVATNTGGIPEVLSAKYGRLTPVKNSVMMSSTIISVFQKSGQYSKNIKADMAKLQKRFSKNAVENYEKIYQG